MEMIMLSLKLVDNNITSDEIKLLAKWRKKVQPLWEETFEVTYEGTKKWIAGIIANPKKMLFFVVKDGKLIGHVGYDEIRDDYCYIGNVIRGEGKSDGSMTYAVKLLINMATKFNVKNIFLSALSSNEKAIKFYEDIGFKVFIYDIKNLIMKYENNTLV